MGLALGTGVGPRVGVPFGVPVGVPGVLTVGSEEGDSLTSVTGGEL